MGIVRTVAIIVLVISFFTFVAFFGRLPALRYVPNLENPQDVTSEADMKKEHAYWRVASSDMASHSKRLQGHGPELDAGSS